MSDKKERRLGRGLSALMADVQPADPVRPEAGQDPATAPRRADQAVPIERVFPNPEQPRRSFTPENLEELAASIREKGIIQPLILRARPGHSGDYEIVAGERRWRAAQMAKLHEVPALIRDFSDTEVLEVAIIENIQRADLNPLEEAMGYRQLMDRFGHTQEKVAEALGKSRSHIANLLRLLGLPDVVQQLLRDGKLSAGHARALITSDDPASLARQVVDRSLSVRETERLAKAAAGGAVDPARPSSQGQRTEKDADTRALEGDLSAALGMRVVIDHADGPGGGKMTITYNDLEQLDSLCGRLTGGLG
ncbi:ParB/RepB/Spo0J family partition protein [Anianabacter salinae]|uniref:ParB/RepB/Spo0J family partition protein n=1 Tax=Anianabacter salinae TaxID=2851023 RepID=UPI00225E6A8C|nr:ParB/RepB/Spo0J family partition protein [Anianabacter salinae]MBV0913519.1 ParB/RepB/Spo0J family partition protein [Anianabacter salinae]